jgi:isoleucyl-tRNA synthetase
MGNLYREVKGVNLPLIAQEIVQLWEEKDVFHRSVEEKDASNAFVFFEGPPSANGIPGIHHVMARAIKDVFCRYQTLKGKRVQRKAGWDTHGLPIELAVEKTLGIKKEDIGSKISVEDYNKACRKEVMKYTDLWESLTREMGYWVDMKDPYITYDNKYIETVWWLLGQLHKKNLLYKGFTIQPYSPAAGTGLSSHELNQPGCYKEVKDSTAVAQFQAKDDNFLADVRAGLPLYFLAWTTTPWTLPSNTALAVGVNIDYCVVKTVNPFNAQPQVVILAQNLIGKYFSEAGLELALDDYKAGDKVLPYQIVKVLKGADLAGQTYHQLLPFVQPDGKAFEVIVGDFVTTEDGTGIVHIAPSFGADDFRVAKQNGISSLTLVDRRGRFVPEVQDGVFLYGEEFVKEDYYSVTEKADELSIQQEKLQSVIADTSKIKYLSVDDRIILKLQTEGKLFKKEKYAHNYPHCWRTDKPILYYPLDSWFIKVPEIRERMVELNKTIHWRPEATGTGRFGNWLESANDWNLSRSRFWGIPLPIWRTADGSEMICIESVEQLKNELDRSVKAGHMASNPLDQFQVGDFSASNYDLFDLHKPYVDQWILTSANGEPMKRESDLIDVWFDSGSMPYAQLHYPFENKALIDERKAFPADFIAEGVDQTRGWFYTLHAIATACFDSVAYKNVVSNGLVLDKNGNKMSKRLGNAVDPFITLSKYGPDATRWYMLTNAQPWDNLKFDEEGIVETQRKLFGTLLNTYQFFAIYANIDSFEYNAEQAIPVEQRPEMDRWIISRLHSLIRYVDQHLSDFDPTPAARAIDEFVDVHLSNWYVRLGRKRFWHGEMTGDKLSAYQTLHECMTVISHLISPFAPFFADWMYLQLTCGKGKDSVHLSDWPIYQESLILPDLEHNMESAQRISSMVLSIRKKENIRVRQPLQSVKIPVVGDHQIEGINAVKELILSEVNVKELLFVHESESKFVKNLKLNFKTLGKKCGKAMKEVQLFAEQNGQQMIEDIEKNAKTIVPTSIGDMELVMEDVEIIPVDIPGWKVVNHGNLTVALDITISPELKSEGIAREIVNRVQNLRKESNLEVTDRIHVRLTSNSLWNDAIHANSQYISNQVLADTLIVVEGLNEGVEVEWDETTKMYIHIIKS